MKKGTGNQQKQGTGNRTSVRMPVPCFLPVPFFMFFLCAPVVFAAAPVENTPPATAKPAVKADKEDVVLNTLNETLKENRDLRTKMTQYEDTVRKLTLDQGALVSQLRRLSAEKEQWSRKVEEEVEDAKSEARKLEEELKQLEEDRLEVERVRVEAEDRVLAIQEENGKLRALLDQAILESERDQYQQLISEAHKKGEEAAERLSDVVHENEAMKGELLHLYYDVGKSLYEAREYRRAAAQYEKALKLDPNDSYLHYNLGLIYDYYLKDNRKAARHYRKYLALTPVEEEAKEIRERLLQLELSRQIIPRQPLRFEYDKEDSRTYQDERPAP